MSDAVRTEAGLNNDVAGRAVNRPWARALLAVGVFVSAVVLWGLADFMLAEAQQDAVQAERGEMRELLARVRIRGSLADRFNNLFDQLSTLPWTASRFAVKAGDLERRHPGILDIYVFDPAGKRVQVPGATATMVFASQQFIRAVRDPDGVQARLSSGFAGNAEAPRLLNQAPGSLVDLVNGDRRTWGGWWRLHDARGEPAGDVVVFVHRGGIAAEVLLDQATAEANRLVGRTFVCGWLDPLQPTVLRPGRADFPAALPAFLDRLSFDQPAVAWQGRSLVVQQGGDGEMLFCLAQAPLAPVVDLRLVRVGIVVILGISFVLLSGVPTIERRLVRKLTLLFLVGGGVPLLVLLCTVMVDRSDRERLLIEQTCDAQIEQLARLDGDTGVVHLPVLRIYRRLAEWLTGRPLGEARALRRRLETLIERQSGLVMCLAVVTRRGTVLFNGRSSTGVVEAFKDARELLPGICRSILQTVNLDPQAGSGAVGGNPLTDVMVRAKYPYTLLDDDDRVVAARLGNQDAVSFFRLIPARDGSFRGIVMAFHDSFVLQTRFLARLDRQWRAAAAGGAQLWALPVSGEKRWPVWPKATLARHHDLRKLRDAVLNTGLPHSRTVWVEGRKYLVSAVRGQFLKGYVLMMARPFAAIQTEARALTGRAVKFSVFMMLLAGVVALLTARTLLAPLQEIGRGLTAMSARDFRARIRPGMLAELAAVGERFNSTMARFGEMQVARSIQETLWPAAGLSGPGWCVGGRCRTATNLGGDHHDWLVLPDGRLVVAAGDVAGHGIPAGLVVASVKMALALSVEQESDPAQVLVSVDRCLREQGGRFKPMTFWLGIYDPRVRKLAYASAGSCYPILLLHGQAGQMLKMAGYPLGSRKKPVFQSDVVDLAPGGRLLLYTDGFPEALRSDGTPFDYANLLRIAEETRRAALPTTIDWMFARVTEWAGSEVPADDQTLVVLDIEAPSA